MVVEGLVLVTEAVSEQKECCGANHPYQCEGEDLLSAPGHDEDRQAQILLLHAERGPLAESIPAGFEIYENPNAQVFLRRIPPKIITDEERQVVEDGMRTYADVQDYKIDVRGNAIAIYTADQDMATLAALGPRVRHASSEENAPGQAAISAGKYSLF